MGTACACGSMAFYPTRLTLMEWLLFRLGVWTDPDYSDVACFAAPMGGPTAMYESAGYDVTKAQKTENA